MQVYHSGDWFFKFVKYDTSPFDLKRYQARLLEIRDLYRNKLPNDHLFGITVAWSTSNQPSSDPLKTFNVFDHNWYNFNQSSPQDPNVFAEFSYPCRNGSGGNCHRAKNGRGTWFLFWDPTLVPEKDILSDLWGLCSPIQEFTVPSVEIQKILTTEFPKHFQLYLHDGVSAVGPGFDQFWGVAPPYYTVYNAKDGSWNNSFYY